MLLLPRAGEACRSPAEFTEIMLAAERARETLLSLRWGDLRGSSQDCLCAYLLNIFIIFVWLRARRTGAYPRVSALHSVLESILSVKL